MAMTEEGFATGILPGYSVVGTCSLCGGAVTCPQLWGGIIPPTPHCSQCGAVPANTHGPTIPMRKP